MINMQCQATPSMFIVVELQSVRFVLSCICNSHYIYIATAYCNSFNPNLMNRCAVILGHVAVELSIVYHIIGKSLCFVLYNGRATATINYCNGWIY